MSKKRDYKTTMVLQLLPIDLEYDLLSGSTVDNTGSGTDPQDVEHHDWSDPGSGFNHDWEGGN